LALTKKIAKIAIIAQNAKIESQKQQQMQRQEQRP